jgi:hypothetical protein
MACEGEMLQAVGRVRPLTRPGAVDLIIIGDMPVPGIGGTLKTARHMSTALRDGQTESAISRYEKHCVFEFGDVVPLGAPDMLTIFPEFGTVKAAERQREKCREPAGWRWFEYKHRTGKNWSRGFAAPKADIAGGIEKALGSAYVVR